MDMDTPIGRQAYNLLSPSPVQHPPPTTHLWGMEYALQGPRSSAAAQLLRRRCAAGGAAI
ncbi:hypothetical protein M5D96_010300 [Drosophila gunungcola]|uniref:Uncharacterized protein n=1 Tax=Drosophila gunungcola TaxID=103775 RepID=A0A9P9YHC4_9MUSC|nr:hypothetical protein M5D96_010300 [Drosophila gunungcola]